MLGNHWAFYLIAGILLPILSLVSYSQIFKLLKMDGVKYDDWWLKSSKNEKAEKEDTEADDSRCHQGNEAWKPWGRDGTPWPRLPFEEQNPQVGKALHAKEEAQRRFPITSYDNENVNENCSFSEHGWLGLNGLTFLCWWQSCSRLLCWEQRFCFSEVPQNNLNSSSI